VLSGDAESVVAHTALGPIMSNLLLELADIELERLLLIVGREIEELEKDGTGGNVAFIGPFSGARFAGGRPLDVSLVVVFGKVVQSEKRTLGCA
jgi:hypothetical protein